MLIHDVDEDGLYDDRRPPQRRRYRNGQDDDAVLGQRETETFIFVCSFVCLLLARQIFVVVRTALSTKRNETKRNETNLIVVVVPTTG